MGHQSAQEKFSGTKNVDSRLAIDVDRLAQWMKENIDQFEGPVSVEQFKGGQSNPTYKIVTPSHSYVLRRKPPGKLLKSAHAVDREYRVMTALGTQNFPVPRTYGLCENPDILGTIFFVMEWVDGRILWDLKIPDVDDNHRRDIFLAKADTLAKLHSIDIDACGLGDYGQRGAYFERQISRWTKQYRASETEKISEMDRLIAWLPDAMPEGDMTTVVHGDYRLDNMVLDMHRPQVKAVLDWELSTLGHPLADFTYYLMQWVMPYQERMGLEGLDMEALAIPSMDETIERYCQKTGYQLGDNGIDFYFAFNLFRLAGICQGIVGRVRDGTATSEHAKLMAERVLPLAQGAWAFAKNAGA